MSYKAFISYSHAADKQLAPTLQSALQGFAKPFYRLRAVNIFRDKTSLHLTPELWPLIKQALHESEFFLLMASPEAAQSEWVQKEIDEWLAIKNGSLEKFLIILTDGVIEWDNAANDFDWNKTSALPPNLKGMFRQEPLYSDLRWARSATDLSLRNPQFLDDVGTLASTIHDKPKDMMVGKDVKAHHLFKLVVVAVIITLLFFTTVASGAAAYAFRQQRIATEEAKHARDAAQREKDAAESEKKAREEAEQATERERTAKQGEQQQREKADQQKALADTRAAEASHERDIAETRRVEAESERRRADEKAEAERRARQTAEIRGLLAEAGKSEVLGQSPEALALFRAASYEEMKAGVPTASYEIEQAAKREALSRVLVTQRNVIESMAASADGKILATASRQSGDIQLWNIATGSPLKSISAFNDTDTVVKLAFSPTDSKLLAAGGYRSVNLCDVESGKCVLLPGTEVNDLPLPDLKFSSDGRLIAIGKRPLIFTLNGLAVVESRTVPIELPQGASVNSYAFSDDARILALTLNQPLLEIKDQSGEVFGHSPIGLYDAATGALLRALEPTDAGPGQHPWSFVFSFDNKYAVALSEDSLHAWSVDDGEPLPHNRLGGVGRFLFVPGTYQVVAESSYTSQVGPGNISVWDLKNPGHVKKRFPAHDQDVSVLAFSDDGSLFATGSRDRSVKLWDTKTWELINTLKGHTDILTGLAFVPHARDLISVSLDGTVREWPLSSSGLYRRVLTKSLDIGPGDMVLSFSHDAARVLVGKNRSVLGDDGRPHNETFGLEIYDTATGKLVNTLQNPNPATLKSLYNGRTTFSKDATHIAIVDQVGRQVQVWDASSGQLQGTLEDTDQANTQGILSVTLSDDLMTVAMMNESGFKQFIELKDIRNDRPLLNLTAEDLAEGSEPHAIERIALSPDGKLFAATVAKSGSISTSAVLLWRRVGDKFERDERQVLFNGAASGMTFTSSGLLVMGVYERGVSDGEFYALNTGSMELKKSEQEDRLAIFNINCASEGAVCVTHSSNSSEIRVWRAADALSSLSQIVPGDAIGGVILSADGSRLITYPNDVHSPSALQVWDTKTGARIDSLPVERLVNNPPLAFSPDTRSVAIAGNEATGTGNQFRIWTAQPFTGDPFLETGGIFNLRVCEITHQVVPVFPFPSPQTVWAPPELCNRGSVK